jgi:RNA polymerase sigma-70 factor (ECF subfamily)
VTELPIALRDALAKARSRWPRIVVDDEVFVPYLEARLTSGSASLAIEGVHVADLYLACACVLADPAALAELHAMHAPAIRAQVARIEPDHADDLAQRILARLLVGEDGDLPRLSTYAGRSALTAWLKVVATREALMHRRRAPDPGVAADDDLHDAVADAHDDPELHLMRERWRDDFRRAFEDALAGLDPGSRTLLRYQLVDRLTIDELARIENVHRATAARRLAKAREHLLRETRRNLAVRMNVPRAELESAFALVRSQLEVSVRRLLGA